MSYVVNKGRSITSPKGILTAGQKVPSGLLKEGAEKSLLDSKVLITEKEAEVVFAKPAKQGKQEESAKK